MIHTHSRQPGLHGIWVALATPLREGALELERAQQLADAMIGAGVHGLVVAGTTGEAAMLTPAEQDALLRAVLEAAHGRCPVMLGLGAGDTASAVRRAGQADKLGLAALLASPPAYVRPAQDGLLGHFGAIADATALPIMLYDIPARCGVSLEVTTVRTLAARPQFCAIKEASGELGRINSLLEQPGLSVLCGDDALLFAALCSGAHGAVSVAAQLRPDLYVQLYDLIRAQQLDQARALFRQLLPMIKLLFSEPNPAPLKAALAMQGLLSEELRLPMTPVTAACRAALAAALERLQAIPSYRAAPAAQPREAQP